MAAAYLDIEQLPLNVIPGVLITFRVTARQASGAVEPGYTGTVVFTSSDAAAALPANYTFVGGDAGTRLFTARFGTEGAGTLRVSDGTFNVTSRFTAARPPGWGFDDLGILPYGDAAAGIGVSLRSALALATRKVEVTVSALAQDNSPYLPGDALNPATWTLQRLDSGVFLNVVSVEQTGTYSYALTTMEEFGPADVMHRVASTTLKDGSGEAIVAPRSADFPGLLSSTQVSPDSRLAAQRVAVRDFANAQLPSSPFYAGTLQLDGGGDYKTVDGAEFVKKLIYRRLTTTPGDFWHLPNYGLGLVEKGSIRATDLPRIKQQAEAQALEEPEVEKATASVTLDPSTGIVYVKVAAQLRKTGQQIEIGYNSGQKTLVL